MFSLSMSIYAYTARFVACSAGAWLISSCYMCASYDVVNAAAHLLSPIVQEVDTKTLPRGQRGKGGGEGAVVHLSISNCAAVMPSAC